MSNGRIAMIVVSAAGLAFGTGLVAAPVLQPQMDPEAEARWMKAVTPDEHHHALQALIGKWEGDVKIWMAPNTEPMESTATFSRKWAMDGRFVFEHVTASSPEGEFKGMGIIGYNTLEKKYESIWIENMATYISLMNGKMDEKKNTMTFHGDVLDPTTGKRQETWHIVDMSNPTRHTAEGWTIGPDGEKFKNFEAVLEKID